MKLKSVVTPLFFSFALHAQLTTVSQLVLNGDGTVFTGEVVIAVPPFSSRSAAVRSRDMWLCSSLNIITGCAQQIVAGVLTVALLPNGGGSPAGTSYFVSYYPDVPPGRRASVKTEYWVVPAGGPFTIDQVRVPTPPVPTAQVNPAQFNPAGYTANQYPCLLAGTFAPCGPVPSSTLIFVDTDPAPSSGLTHCTYPQPLRWAKSTNRIWGCQPSGSTALWNRIDISPVQNHDLHLTFLTQGESPDSKYVALTDGTGDNAADSNNICTYWGDGFSAPKGILTSGPCPTLTDLRWNAFPVLRLADIGACAFFREGQIAYIVDALAPAFLQPVTGGGTVKTPVFCNGVNWVPW